MALTNRSRRTHLGCECLEDRCNPAGNVTASLVNNQLFVTGDANSNMVSTQQDAQGHLFVIGVNGTLVNGVGAVALGLQQSLTDAVFQGGGGNDSIDVAGLTLSSGLSVRTGDGSDLITLRNLTALYVSAYPQGGNDMIQTTGVTALVGADFDGGTGFDIWENNGATAGTYMTNRNIEQFTGAAGPGGVNAFISGGQLFVVGDTGSNAVSTQQDVNGNLFVFGVNGTLVNGQPFVSFGPGILTNAVFQGNGGNDQFDVAGLIVTGGISVVTGEGNDFVQIRNVTAQYVSAYMNGGNDMLRTAGVIAQIGADFAGGNGFDIWVNPTGVAAGSYLTHREFDSLQ